MAAAAVAAAAVAAAAVAAVAQATSLAWEEIGCSALRRVQLPARECGRARLGQPAARRRAGLPLGGPRTHCHRVGDVGEHPARERPTAGGAASAGLEEQRLDLGNLGARSTVGRPPRSPLPPPPPPRPAQPDMDALTAPGGRLRVRLPCTWVRSIRTGTRSR